MKRGALLLICLAFRVNAAPPTCITCHAAQAKPYPATPMSHALEVMPHSGILVSHPVLTFTSGKYSYKIERKGDQSTYSVSDGQQTLSAPVGWVMGLGAAGQTYIFEKDGELYESRVSYFREIDALDFTLGALSVAPTNILEAAGRIIGKDQKAKCFGCHATDATAGMELTLDKMTPGVQCSRCHGPTGHHLEGIRTGDAKLAAMTQLSKYSTEQISNFCGQCHRTWAEIAVSSHLGIADIRFQPYRLTNSKCYDTDDPRISCIACHNPHQPLNKKASDYDAKCQACHAGGKPSAHPCKVAQTNCVSCHMPKLELPGSHHRFSDHQIRIVKANEKYPD